MKVFRLRRHVKVRIGVAAAIAILAPGCEAEPVGVGDEPLFSDSVEDTEGSAGVAVEDAESTGSEELESWEELPVIRTYGDHEPSEEDQFVIERSTAHDCPALFWDEHVFVVKECGGCGADKRRLGKIAGLAMGYICPGGGACCSEWYGETTRTEWCEYC
ncbi:MAG: hypothetical protein ACRBN8_41010 [Nannocystales bacterium]